MDLECNQNTFGFFFNLHTIIFRMTNLDYGYIHVTNIDSIEYLSTLFYMFITASKFSI